MEIEDFNDDDAAPLPPARGRGTLGSRAGSMTAGRGRAGGVLNGRGPGVTRAPGGGGFGLDSEVDSGGLDAELQRLGLADPLPQPPPRAQPQSFGLDAETGGAPPGPSLTAADLPPPSPGLGLAGEASLRPRGGPLLPLPAPAADGGGGGFGLDSEVRAARPGPELGRGALPPSGPGSRRPSGGPGAGGFGLERDLQDATAAAGGLPPPGLPPPGLPPPGLPPPGLPPPGPGFRRPSGGAAGFGLDSDVRAAAAAGTIPPTSPLLPPAGGPGSRRPSGGYGLDSDVRAAAAAGVLPPTRMPGPVPGVRRPPSGTTGFGLAGEIEADEEEEAAAGAAAAAAAAAAAGGQQYYGLESEVAAGAQMPGMGPDQYGLESDLANYNQQQQRWSTLYANTVGLDQLEAMYPQEERWLEMTAAQAARSISELHERRVPLSVVDVLEARDKFVDCSAPPRLAYLAAVERAAADQRLLPHCRPSLLQTKLKAGQNKLRKLIEPVMDPGDQGFVDFSYSPEGALQPETSRVWQFGLGLVQATAVGKTGLQRVRAPCLFIARLAVFDRRANRFLGNILGVRPEAVSNYDKRWEFNPQEQIIVRCCCMQSDPQAGTRLVTDDALSIFVEFNVSYRLTVEDTVHMPQNEYRSSQVLDEINTCWAMISFKKCLTLTREVEITVPLYYGSIYDPQPMTAFYAQKRSKTPFLSAFKGKESPVLQFRVGPLGVHKPPLVPYAYMPTTMLATHDLATALAAYRMNLALSLARQAGPFAAAADPVLAGFPPLLGDHHLLAEFLTRWRDLTNKMTAIIDVGCCSPEVLPPLGAMVEAFRRCTIELAPLAHCPTIPPRHINNFVEYQGHRLRLIQHYCHVLDPRTNKILGQRHPVEPLSHAGFEFLHAPFDVSEVRLCLADKLERPEPFYRH